MKKQLIFLGTGEAMVTTCYHACFVIKTERENMLIDAGGGNGILSQLKRANIKADALDSLFLTHKHTDHILGAVWLLRDIAQKTIKAEYDGHLTVYGHDEVVDTLVSLCDLLFSKKLLQALEKRVSYCVVTGGQKIDTKEKSICFFDIQSKKCKQFGISMVFHDGASLAYLGDEPYNAANREKVVNADWLISEAFCLSKDIDLFHPYEMSHATVLDAAQNAKTLGAKNLVLIHTEDSDLAHRKENYTKEAKTVFDGNVFVPEDLECLPLDLV